MAKRTARQQQYEGHFGRYGGEPREGEVRKNRASRALADARAAGDPLRIAAAQARLEEATAYCELIRRWVKQWLDADERAAKGLMPLDYERWTRPRASA
jgi:hypothetical protein